jgi:kumamolisin
VNATITLKGPDLPTPAQMTRALSREEIATKFGVPKKTVQKVERVLKSYGLRVLEVTQGGRSLKVRGSAADIRSAFRAKFAMYQVPGEGQIRARKGVLKVPNELDGIVTGVFGLDQRRMARRQARAAARQSTARQSTPRPLTPARLERQYKFPAGYGAGKTIAIAEFGQDLGNGAVLTPVYIPADVASFCKRYRRPVPKIRIESVGLSPHMFTRQQYKTYRGRLHANLRPLQDGMTGETMMDAQIVAALCPKADIGVYFATWGERGWVNLLDAVTSGSGPVPVALSISYGLAEEDADWSGAALSAINERLQIAALQGITVCVSSGDDGSGCSQLNKRCHVQFPSSSPYVLSVGGTMLATKAGGKVVEKVWWQKPGWRGGGATGGGVSTRNPRAPWQSVQIRSRNPGARDGRVVPDVSALAGPPYYRLVFNGALGKNGGTSAATPLWASLIARIDAALPTSKRQRFLPPFLHKPSVGAAGFHDIKRGKNASHPDPGFGYHARKGFDAVSGWGVPHGRRLLDALARV